MYPLIGDFIEIGLDILNPIQPRAAGMDRQRLKKRFGQELCFWGGIDIQHTLPRGTPQEIRDEVREAVRVLRKNGGYVLGPDFVPLFIFDGDRSDSDLIQIDLEQFYSRAGRTSSSTSGPRNRTPSTRPVSPT